MSLSVQFPWIKCGFFGVKDRRVFRDKDKTIGKCVTTVPTADRNNNREP